MNNKEGELLPSGRIVIVAGGELTAECLRLLDEEDYIIGADRGALFLIDHGFTPSLPLVISILSLLRHWSGFRREARRL